MIKEQTFVRICENNNLFTLLQYEHKINSMSRRKLVSISGNTANPRKSNGYDLEIHHRLSSFERTIANEKDIVKIYCIFLKQIR